MKAQTAILCLLACLGPFEAFGFLDPGADAFEQGHYAQAAEAYAHASESPEALYNLGSSCYKQAAFEEALQHFEKALPQAAPALQQRIYYNSGNTHYRLGQGTQEQDPQATIKSWEAALDNLKNALQLDAEDADARFNHDFIKQKLEKLKQQQEQQHKDEEKQKEEQKEQDQQKQENPEKNPEDPQDPKQDSREKDSDPDSKQDSNAEPKEDPSTPNPKNPKPEGESPQQPEPEPKKEEPTESPAQQPKEPKADEQPQPQEAPQPTRGHLSQEEAARILDAGAQNEKQLPLARPSGNESKNSKNPEKTW